MRPAGKRLIQGGVLIAAGIIVALIVSAPTRPAPVTAQRADGALIRNGSFEDGGAGVPAEWYFDPNNKSKGQVSVDAANSHSGRHLVLQPSSNNRDEGNLLAVGEAVPLEQVKGKRLKLSVWLRARGGATAIAGVYALRKNGSFLARQSVESDVDAWQARDTTLEIPDSSELALVIVMCSVRGTSGSAGFDDVSLTFDTAAAAAAPASEAAPAAAHGSIAIDASREIRRIPRTLYGTNLEWVYNGYGLWDPDKNELNPDIVRLTKALRVSLLRFPGGFFADFYDWRKGVGPHDSRGRSAHSPNGPVSTNNFGTDEVMQLADLTGADLQFIVNIVTGKPADAAEWLRYTNGPGKHRVKYWEIGNESYGKEGSAYSEAATMNPAEYARRYLAFARALRAVDPGVKLMAIGGANEHRYNMVVYPEWDKDVLSAAGADIDLLAVHNAYYPLAFESTDPDVRQVYRALLAAPALIRENLATLSRQIDQYAPKDRAAKIGLAVTEWGPFFHVDLKTPLVDHVKTLGSALYVASVLKVFVETPRLEVANFFKLVDNLFMGWIGVRDGQYVPKAPYLAFSLFTNHFGDVLVASTTESPTYSTEPFGLVDRVSGVPYLEAVVSRTGDKLYVLVINKDFDRDIPTSISINGFRPTAAATAWTLRGTGIDANTGTLMASGRQAHAAEDRKHPRFGKGGPGEVTLTSRPLTNVSAKLEYTFPAASVTVLELSQ